MIVRADLESVITTALAVISAPETPEWLRTMAFRTYEDMAWHLQWDDGCSATWESRSGLLLWAGSYGYEVAQFLAGLPDATKARHPADVFIAEQAAKAADTHDHSVDFRLECCATLNRTLWRLMDDYAVEYDSIPSESVTFLAHLGRITIGVSFPGDDDDTDDDEIDYDDEQFERSTNGPH